MVLVGVSGSSKCDWQIIENETTISSFSTGGLNPYFHSEEEIYALLMNTQELKGKLPAVIYVYSAGCGSKSFQNIIKRAVAKAFPKSNYYVNHDIVAAALATYEGQPCIASILGTGSNACYFDGDIVRQETPALDYVLGDEGGGSNYGKQLLNAYFYKQLPADISELFEDEYKLNKDEVLDHVYRKPYPNVYLASFMKFIQTNKEHSYFQEMVRNGMSKFMDYYILKIHKFDAVQAHFTGTIAYNFSDILKDVAASKNINVGKIIKEPISDLVNYHFKKRYR